VRQVDLLKKRKRTKLSWIKKMYEQGHLETAAATAQGDTGKGYLLSLFPAYRTLAPEQQRLCCR
jgi:hypothetical protein